MHLSGWVEGEVSEQTSKLAAMPVFQT
jgi:hypothetical protein